ncbi:hypothetical protein SPRG_00254 [Saprolegnia parasitica CBS 223.65]|uniref:CRAL-TRIO domain-containing protein n=1 Tax=Saprolegnia parasitica (strain CBS 223.65) TaxID=695850 RepID=A0A067CXG4_SAPPC|nr:hypothetical protein SPRG_00254 [Saprolegnia parasitica CBS 223.65]KDO35404.1 hypothetical protein SPRG_00254 [Saprolegnia parasitica CBS 223.65]|eukprot:XP_012193747.1 hypothetical protein SPRG_00254 [Saprolegnia parasitica CBS 223.65]
MTDGTSGGDLDALLAARASELDTLKALVGDVLTPVHDDVWLLRYLLSNETPAACEAPIRFTIQWRAARADTIAALHAGAKPALYAEIEKYLVAGDHKLTCLGEPLVIVRIGLCNSKALMNNVAHENVVEYMMLAREATMVYLDAKSRETRTLLKAITILDFCGFSLLRGHDARFSRVQGECSKLSEQMYPQLLGRTIFVNTPAIFSWVFKLLKPLLSERTIAKMVICPGGKQLSDCPYVSTYLKLSDLPTFLGGQCTCDGRGCIGGIPNSQTTPLTSVDDDGLASMTLAPRSTQSIERSIATGCVFEYTLGVPGKRVLVSVSFTGRDTSTVLPILPAQFLDQATGCIDGVWSSPSDGVITIRFDANDAVFRSRDVQYKVDVVASSF